MSISRSIHLACLTALSVCALARSAAADDHWSESTAFTRSDQTAIRVVEPEGYKVTITMDGSSQTDAAPVVFRVPATDAYYALTFVAPNGATWTHKFEAHRYQTTEVHVKHLVDAPVAAKPVATAPVRLYIGSVKSKIKTCNVKAQVRVEFVTPAGVSAVALELASGALGQTSLPGGTYDVRVFVMDKNAWTYQSTSKIQINGDGWLGTAMCDKAGLEVKFGE